MRKIGAMGGTNDTVQAAASPVPAPVVSPTPAPGLRGPSGLSPRQNYSRVNTGVVPSPDAGALEQKSLMPKVGSHMSISMAARPRALNDMLKTAMESAISRSKIAEAARSQLEDLGRDDEDEKKKEKDSCMKSASVPTDYAKKLAAASDYIVEMLKEGAEVGPGQGPGALSVGPTTPDGPDHVLSGSTGHAQNSVPTSVPLQKARPQENAPTQMANDDDRAPGTGDAPVNGSTKNAAPLHLLRKMAATEEELAAAQMPPLAQQFGNWAGRNAPELGATVGGLAGLGYLSGQALQGATQGMAGDATPYPAVQQAGGAVPGVMKTAAPVSLLRKLAEDAINPARISAGPASTTILPQYDSSEPGPPAEGKGRVPATAQGVADLTRREAKSVPKREMGALLDESMQSASADNVLQQAFGRTNEAGAKVSSDNSHATKVAAARALLQSIAGGGQ